MKIISIVQLNMQLMDIKDSVQAYIEEGYMLDRILMKG